MIDLDEYQRRRALIDRKLREAERLAGRAEQALLRLQEECGCVTEEEALTKAARLEKKLVQMEAEYEAGWATWLKEYGDLLEGSG